MTNRSASTAGLGATELQEFALTEPDILADPSFSLFGEGGNFVDRLAAAIDAETDLLTFLAARSQAAAAYPAMHGSVTLGDDDAHSDQPGGNALALPSAESAPASSPNLISDPTLSFGLDLGAGGQLATAASLVGVYELAEQSASPMSPTSAGTTDFAGSLPTAAAEPAQAPVSDPASFLSLPCCCCSRDGDPISLNNSAWQAADASSGTSEEQGFTYGAANGTFDIEIVYSGNAAYRTYFDQAAARWEQIITADIADFGGIDDLRINASVVTIDGSGGILGQAGWDAKRPGSTGLPYLGSMEFDAADVQNLVNAGGFLSVAVHEIGHILGIGTLWSDFGLLVGAGGSNPGYVGTHALNEYRALAGNPALTAIPVENSGGAGTRNSHWRESTFDNEIMTGWIDAGANPLSRMTIASLEDFGYAVNYAAADAYNIPGLSPPPPPSSPPPPPPPSGPVQPVITFAGGGDTGAVAFGENAKLVGIVTATGALSYSIVGGTDAGKFQIDGSTGALSFLAAPNFEAPTDNGANNSYVVQVRAANGSLFDTQTVTVNVLNLNERPTNDHNGDLRSDLLWTHDSGQLAIWNMSGGERSGYSFLGSVGPDWSVAQTGDFNGDTHTDILWRHVSGAVAVWDIVNSQQVGYHFVGPAGNDWHIADTGDFNGDRVSDILWRHDSGQLAIWDMNGSQRSGYHFLGSIGPDWTLTKTGDFNGDGQTDVLWRHTTGAVAVWDISGGQQVGYRLLENVGNDWEVADVNDFNGDGRADIVWSHDSGQLAIWEMNGGQRSAYHFLGYVGPDWELDKTGDFNGNGHADILWRHTTGAAAVWDMIDGQQVGYHFLGNVGTDWHLQ
jgi:Leishmanolysin/FG-GAP-like repeat